MSGNALESVSPGCSFTHTIHCPALSPSLILSCSAPLPPTPKGSTATFVSGVAGSPDHGTSTSPNSHTSTSSGWRAGDNKDGSDVPSDAKAHTQPSSGAGSPYHGTTAMSPSRPVTKALVIEDRLRRDAYTKDLSAKKPPPKGVAALYELYP